MEAGTLCEPISIGARWRDNWYPMNENELPGTADLKSSSPARQVLLVGAVLMYWAYTVVLAWAEYGTPCRAGGEGFLPTVFAGLPVIGIAATGVWLLRASVPMLDAHRWAIMSAMGLALLITIPQVLVVSVMGHHPCGPRFNEFMAFTEAWDRWIPVVNIAFIAAAAMVGLGPYVRKLDGAEQGS